MPKWLQGIVGPTIALWLFAFVWGGLAAGFPDGISKRAELASRVALSLIVSSWVTADARKRGRNLPYDFDTLLFFAWPLMLPVYLLQTRKLRVFFTLLSFIGVGLVAWAGAFVILLLKGD